MQDKLKIAVLGSTGYVGLELINILSKHPNALIKALGSDTYPGKNINEFDKRISKNFLPKLEKNNNIDLNHIDLTFLALPHIASHEYVKNNFSKSKIIDLSADFRLDDVNIYEKNYNTKHSCPELLESFVYGLPELNNEIIKKSNNVSIPGCYPTSIILPLFPLLKKNLLKKDNIIVDSKSGYSGAGKKFDKINIFNDNNYNFYNYNTNNHRHICEIQQELSKSCNSKINFSFNPHIMPIFRGMMSTIYCDLEKGATLKDLNNELDIFYKNANFIKIIEDEERLDFFKIQNTNYCYIKLFNHYNISKVIIVSAIDNLLKGASGQAVQCMNLMYNLNENLALEN